MGVECIDYAVEEQIHCVRAHFGCAAISWVVYSITPHGESCAVGVALFWAIVHHYSSIGDVLPPIKVDSLLVYEKRCGLTLY